MSSTFSSPRVKKEGKKNLAEQSKREKNLFESSFKGAKREGKKRVPSSGRGEQQ